MAWWGKALAFGPNRNDFDYLRPADAFPSAQRASDLSAVTTPVEKALIGAMALRYSNDSLPQQDKLNIGYRNAMKKIYQQFGNNENVSTLYADALMLLHPWDLYNHDFTPEPWTNEIV